MRRFQSFFKGRVLRVATAFVAQVAGAGFAFLFSIMLARLVGVAGVGLYFLAITIVDIGATISRLGLENAALRFASISYSRGDRGSLAALYRSSIGLTFGAAIVVVLPVWLIVSHLPLGGSSAPELREELPLLVLSIAPLALLIVQTEFLKGIGETSLGTFAQAVVTPLLLLAACAVFWFTGGATAHMVLIAYLVVAIISMAFAMVLWNRRLPGIWSEAGKFDLARLLRTSMPLLVIASMNLVMGWTGILVLGGWSNASAVGIYGIASRIALLTTFVLSAISIVAGPRFAALYAEGKHADLERLAQRSAWWSLVLVAPLILVLVLVPDLILQLFGPQFKEGAWPVRILALGQLVNAATGSVGGLLMMTGHEKLMRNNIAASAALNLLGNLILVPAYGAGGAAASTALSLVFMNMVSWIIARKKLCINVLDYAALRRSPCVNR